ncbi:MAG: MFS transporter [Gemmataceae bacterium]
MGDLAGGALGGLLFGYDWVVIGGAKPFFERYFALTDPLVQGWANSCALLGCLVGAMLAGGLSDRFGRKCAPPAGGGAVHRLVAGQRAPRYCSCCLCSGVSWAGCGDWAGVGTVAAVHRRGGPAALRGRLVSINQLTIVVGILLAQGFVNWYLVRRPASGGGGRGAGGVVVRERRWRWMFGLTAVPSLLFLLGVFAPRKARAAGDPRTHRTARRVLSRIGVGGYADAALAEIEARATPEQGRRRCATCSTHGCGGC